MHVWVVILNARRARSSSWRTPGSSAEAVPQGDRDDDAGVEHAAHGHGRRGHVQPPGQDCQHRRHRHRTTPSFGSPRAAGTVATPAAVRKWRTCGARPARKASHERYSRRKRVGPSPAHCGCPLRARLLRLAPDRDAVPHGDGVPGRRPGEQGQIDAAQQRPAGRRTAAGSAGAGGRRGRPTRGTAARPGGRRPTRPRRRRASGRPGRTRPSARAGPRRGPGTARASASAA